MRFLHAWLHDFLNFSVTEMLPGKEGSEDELCPESPSNEVGSNTNSSQSEPVGAKRRKPCKTNKVTLAQDFEDDEIIDVDNPPPSPTPQNQVAISETGQPMPPLKRAPGHATPDKSQSAEGATSTEPKFKFQSDSDVTGTGEPNM